MVYLLFSVQTVVLYAMTYKPTQKIAIQNSQTPKEGSQNSSLINDNHHYDKTNPVSSTYHQTTEGDNSSYIISRNVSNNYEEAAFTETDSFKEFNDFTPPVSRNGHYTHLSRSRSRSNTPLQINTSLKSPCNAKTRVGTPCKLTSLPGRLYCYRHQSGDSVIG